MSAELTMDLLANKDIRKIDIFEYIAFIEAAEPDITLSEFADRLWDEVTDLKEQEVKLYTLIINKDSQ